MTIGQLRRIRLGVRATFAVGLAVSLMANVLHAQDDPISKAISAWPPIALMLTVELISRVPVHRRSLAIARLVATATIAGIAGWVSYWHMASVAASHGEASFGSQYLWPLTVDGLIVVASICLVEIAGRLASLEEATSTTTALATIPVATDDPGQDEWTDPWQHAVPVQATGQLEVATTAGQRDAGPSLDTAVATWMDSSGGQQEVQVARTKVASTAVATRRPVASYDQAEARSFIGRRLGQGAAVADLDREVASRFDVSERTARRLRGQVTGSPVSGPPSAGQE